MPLPILSFDEFVNKQASAMQALAVQVLDFSVGAILRAIIESNSGNSVWLETLFQDALAIARLQTCTGNEVDTWINQFGLYRILPIMGTGAVTFARFSSTMAATIPAAILTTSTNTNGQKIIVITGSGALVSCLSNGVTYTVYADTTNPYYSVTDNAYIIPIGISSIDVPVIALTPGSIGNVLSDQITIIVSIIPYVDTVNNSQPITNGADQESDAAVKVRFPLYLESLSKAIKGALQAAISGVPGVARYDLQENVDILGNPYIGFFYVVVDDGTGDATSALLANVSAAVNATRGFTIRFAVYAPTPTPISILAHVFTDHSVPDSDVHDAVIAALEMYITEKGYNTLFPYSQIPQVIYDVNSQFGTNPFSPITNVTNWLLDGGSSDVVITGIEVATVGSLTITMNG